MDRIEKINKICREILKLTDKDLQAADKMAEEQAGYIHPLKGATQEYLNKTGKKNKKIILALKKLRQEIIDSND